MLTPRKIWKYVRWPLAAILLVYVWFVLQAVHWPISKTQSDAAVAAIHAQHLTMRDVDGSNLPPTPDPKKVDSTIAGVDANKNGIRDDVELAIFDKYTSDMKLRGAALQYAMAYQMYITSVINTETWIAANELMSRAQSCVFNTNINDPVARKVTEDFVYASVINTSSRKTSFDRSESFATSFVVPAGDKCDISG